MFFLPLFPQSIAVFRVLSGKEIFLTSRAGFVSVSREKRLKAGFESGILAAGRSHPELLPGFFPETHPAVEKAHVGQKEGIVRMANEGLVKKEMGFRKIPGIEVDPSHECPEAVGPAFPVENRS